MTLLKRDRLGCIHIFLFFLHPKNFECAFQSCSRSCLIKDFHILAIIKRSCACGIICRLTVVVHFNLYILLSGYNERSATALLGALRVFCRRISVIAYLNCVRESNTAEGACILFQRSTINALNIDSIVVCINSTCSNSGLSVNAPDLVQRIYFREINTDGVVSKRPSELVNAILVSSYTQVVVSCAGNTGHTGPSTIQSIRTCIFLGQPSGVCTQRAYNLELIVALCQFNLISSGFLIFSYSQFYEFPVCPGTCDVIYRSCRSRDLFDSSIPLFVIEVRFSSIPCKICSLTACVVIEDDSFVFRRELISIYILLICLQLCLRSSLARPCSLFICIAIVSISIYRFPSRYIYEVQRCAVFRCTRNRDLLFCIPCTFELTLIVCSTRHKIRLSGSPLLIRGLNSTVIEDYIYIRSGESICIYILFVDFVSFFLSSLTRPPFVSVAFCRPNECIYVCPIQIVYKVNRHRVNRRRRFGGVTAFAIYRPFAGYTRVTPNSRSRSDGIEIFVCRNSQVSRLCAPISDVTSTVHAGEDDLRIFCGVNVCFPETFFASHSFHAYAGPCSILHIAISKSIETNCSIVSGPPRLYALAINGFGGRRSFTATCYFFVQTRLVVL